MNPGEMIKDILTKKESVKNVFFVACGGSLVEFYPPKYFMDAEAKSCSAFLYSGKEFVCAAPASLGENSLVLLCSHSGKTPEVLEAAALARERGAVIVTYAGVAGTPVNEAGDYNVVYGNATEEGSHYGDSPVLLSLRLMGELLAATEEYPLLDQLKDGISKIDTVIYHAMEQVEERARVWGRAYEKEDMMYILGSGPAFGNVYGFAICSMMEMQWQHAAYIHSAEYFHGPFEVTDKNTAYVVLESSGPARCMDERAIRFLKQYGAKYEVVDAKELGADIIDERVVDYFTPLMFYKVMCVYRKELAKLRNHPLETRRYMGKVEY
ncbi:MAG: SIS domain-containing protein [Lachnospiraceae bacterium]|nr:SIS domain-containing protein [Lachnospiraceae bacterium]MCI9149058.1 SIS domain-containing protein [Lachnospiraceae bacterium]